MSSAVQRRQRGLERERAGMGRLGRKSSVSIMKADHGEGADEKASKTLDALLRARQTGFLNPPMPT